jgi:hypothetical protein
VEETIGLVGLGDRADARTGRLSGGQQRRLDVGLALIGDPELLFLDEPTTGFDPSARRQAWETIAGLRDLGKTVFLTTHYMDEAQRLADRVAIIAGGRVVARGTPEDLGGREDRPTTISYRLDGEQRSLQTTTPVQALHELTGRAISEGLELEGLEARRPDLEDVYLGAVAAGCGDAEARRRAESVLAESALGSVPPPRTRTPVSRPSHVQPVGHGLAGLAGDVKFACRQLRRAPAPTAIRGPERCGRLRKRRRGAPRRCTSTRGNCGTAARRRSRVRPSTTPRGA